MSARLGLLAVLFALTAACQPQAAAGGAGVERSAAGLEQVPLTIESRGRTHRFTVEVARSPAEQSQGLMFRQNLPPDPSRKSLLVSITPACSASIAP